MAKSREVTDADEAMAKLGVKSPEVPGGDAVTTVGLPEEQVQEPVSQEPVTTEAEQQEEPVQQNLDLGEEPKVSSTQNADGSLTEEEKQRRTWQAEADKARAEQERVQREYEERVRLLQEQNRQLTSVVTPLIEKYNVGTQQAPSQEKPPEYIVDGMFDKDQHAEFLKWHDERLLQQAEQRITSSLDKREQERLAREQANEVVKKYPEYRNPLTGQPDYDRIERDIRSASDQLTLVDMIDRGRGVKTSKDPLASPASIEAIEKNADKPQSVVGSPAAEAQAKTPVPDKLRKAHDTFGNFELPADYGGLSED